MLSLLRRLQPAMRQASLLQPSAAAQAGAVQPAAAVACGISTSSAARGLEEFFDTPGKDDAPPTAGRGWTARELRSKSWDDLHKLWYVLLKERSMLQSEKLRARAAGATLQNPFRLPKVRKSMARIKLVLWERALAEPDAHKARELKRFVDAI